MKDTTLLDIAPSTQPQTNIERVAEIRARMAEGQSGITRWQKRQLTKWWTAYYGEVPGPEVTAEEMVEKFLNPPHAQWSRLSPYGQSAVACLDEPDAFTKKVKEVVGIVDKPLPTITVQILRLEFCGGVRGELLLLPGREDDRYNAIVIQCGHVKFICNNRLPGPPFSLPICPTPQLKDDPWRTYLSNYKGSMGRAGQFLLPGEGPKTYEPLPRTLDSLLPEPPQHIKTPEWHETHPVKVVANLSLDLEYYPLIDQQETTLPAWLACVLCVQKTRHGEPFVKWLDEPDDADRRFIPAVEAFRVSHPGARTDHPDFPVYSTI